MENTSTPSIPLPPPPPPPPVPPPKLLMANSKSRNNIPNLESSNNDSQTDGNIIEKLKQKVEESFGFSTRREQLLQQINDMYNQNYPPYDENGMQRNSRVKIVTQENIADVKVDEWLDDEIMMIADKVEAKNKQVSTTTNNNGDSNKDECSKTYYMCRSKDGETPQPINLHFPAKTTVIIIDRRKTDNGSHNFFCSLDVSKEGKKKLIKQRMEEEKQELKSLPKGNIAQILKRLRNQQDDSDHENDNEITNAM